LQYEKFHEIGILLGVTLRGGELKNAKKISKYGVKETNPSLLSLSFIARISSARPHRKVMGTSRERYEKSESWSLDIKEGPLVILLLLGERIIV
jgi:hypothetical protein